MTLDAADVIAGAAATRTVDVPAELLALWSTVGDARDESADHAAGAEPRTVTLRPLTIGDVGLITRASRDDPGLVPVLMLVRAVAEPTLSPESIQRLPAGLGVWLLEEVSRVSGLTADAPQEIRAVAGDGVVLAYTALAHRYGWTPDQVDRLTPAQLALFLADDDAPIGARR